MSETTPTTPPKLTFATIITLVAIVAQGLMTVELFDATSVPGKLLQVLAMVLTALGAPLVARAGRVLPTALLVLLVVGVASPGCTHNDRSDTIHAALVATDSAHAGFVAWDRAHQLALVERATSRDQGEAELAAYRARRDPVEKLLVGVYRAIAAAALANDDQSVASLAASAAQLHLALTALTGGKL